ncbi:carboxypeptidase regulatory-like domain-containing protein [Myxococcus stipitatus]|uniref:carboxypeptidase regulatory-like domain-containing protein n=1 Tax=Myxococcus stipitatus TaxID=83455 RepID=UPI001F4567B5|nr:carboxypeptidase regulatory-like domain-containing protein [Myxococcus stipitatus]MCE9668595.1 carboxypeptidase regulatory-like domain-containing protein [Myxococcus stipitatus]
MRRPVFIMLGVLVLGASVAVVLVREMPPEAAEPAATKGAPVMVVPQEPARAADLIRGLVLTKQGAPVAGVEVSATRSLPGETLSTLPCGEQEPELSLSSPECQGAPRLELMRLVAEGRGDAPVVARTTSRADGSFSLEGVSGTPVALWVLDERGAVLKPEVMPGDQDVRLELTLTRKLSARVVDEEGDPIVDARVTVFPAKHSRYFEARTDQAGHFEVGLRPPEGEGIVISSPGFVTLYTNEPWGHGRKEFVLHPPRDILGQVFFQERPAAGVEVRAAETGHSTVTDDDGRFALKGLEPGDFTLLATRENLSARATVKLSPRTRVIETRLTLAEPIQVEGNVQDDTGRPIEGAVVKVLVDKEEAPRLEVTTGADGRFTLETHPIGPCRFEVDAEGYLETVEPDGELLESTRSLDFTLRRALLISGVVFVGDLDQPFDGYGLALERLDGPKRPEPDWGGEDTTSTLDDEAGGVATTECDDDGRFSFEVAHPGRYRLFTSPSQRRMGRHLDFTQEVLAPSQGLRVVIREGARIQGTVVDSRGRPASRASVTLREGTPQAPGKVVATTTAGESGASFDVGALPPGSYVVQAGPPDGTVPSDARMWPVQIHGAETATVKVQLEVEVEPSITISGIVVTEDGRELAPGLTVLAHGPGASAGARTDEQGRFTLEKMRPGTTRFMVQAAGYSLITHPPSQPTSMHPHPPTTIEVEEGREVRLVLRYNGGFRGRVLREDGTPIQRFSVNLSSVEAPDGRFEVTTGPGREMPLRVSAPGFASVIRVGSVERGSNTDLGDITLKTGWRMRGRAVDARTSAPVVGAEVRILSVQEEARMYHTPPKLEVTSTGPDGAFEFPNLGEAAHKVAISHPDYLPLLQPVGANDSKLELRLSRAAQLTVVAVDRRGKPAQVVVTLQPLDGRDAEEFLVDDDGTYTAPQLASGTYVVTPHESRTPDGEEDLFMRFQPRRIELKPGDHPRLVFRETVGPVNLRLRHVAASSNERFIHHYSVLLAGDVPLPSDKQTFSSTLEPMKLFPDASDSEGASYSHLAEGRYTYFVFGFARAAPPPRPPVVHRELLDVRGRGHVRRDVQLQWRPWRETP